MRRLLASLVAFVMLAGVVHLEVEAVFTDSCCECCDDDKAAPAPDQGGADCGGEQSGQCSCCAQLHVFALMPDADGVVLAPSRSAMSLDDTTHPDAPPRKILHVPRVRVA